MTIPYLIDYTPYIDELMVCKTIDDMVSIDLIQEVPSTQINYNIGSLEDITMTIAIKNITNNANVEAILTVDPNIFLVDTQIVPSKNKIIAPEETARFVIQLNKASLDNMKLTVDSNIELTVNSVLNGRLITKNVSVSKLTARYLPETLTPV